jgi:hypothetical protein
LLTVAGFNVGIPGADGAARVKFISFDAAEEPPALAATTRT